MRGGALPLAEPVDPLADRLRPEPLEKVLRVRPPRLGEQHLAAEARQKLGELLGVARLVEQVGAEHEIPGRGAQQRLRLAPADSGDTEGEAVAIGVPLQQPDCILGPVGREHLGAAARRRERRQPEPAAELEDTEPSQLTRRDMASEREAARPELGPVGQELLLVEGRLVDQLLGTGRAQYLEAQPVPELDLLLDERFRQSFANRSIGTPSGSRSCA